MNLRRVYFFSYHVFGQFGRHYARDVSNLLASDIVNSNRIGIILYFEEKRKSQHLEQNWKDFVERKPD